MAKKLMLGNEAVARGLYEAGVTVVSSYPGTPSTEITEHASKYDAIYSEWAPNEKVAMETAIGASIAGARSFCAMKHVGLNVAADPLFTASYTGVNGGMVVAVADDPGMHSSQNEQDSRHYAIAAKLPMLEPSDSGECRDFAKRAYEISEQFDPPVLLRLSTRIAHSQSIVDETPRQEVALKEYEKNAQKYVMMPAMARGRHVAVEERMEALRTWTETCSLNRVEWGSRDIGVICSGTTYAYAKEALGEKASYLKLGMVNPLPTQLILGFANQVGALYVLEELDGILEAHCKEMGLHPIGKEKFPLLGEYNQRMIKEAVLGEADDYDRLDSTLPVRPPVMCAGCPHRGVFYVLNKLKLTVSGDIGCYTLGAAAPLNAIDTTVCMGASISALHGFNKARAESHGHSVAVIGDSTFIHSGITSLINVAYNQGNSTVLILDNSITGMTGHQQNPTTGYTIKGDPTAAVSLEQLCQAVGIRRVTVVDPSDIERLEQVIKTEIATDQPSVIITRRPCALLKHVKHNPPFSIQADQCRGCKACLKIGCPAISMKGKTAQIDQTLCVGCNLCTKLCKFGAIHTSKEEGK